MRTRFGLLGATVLLASVVPAIAGQVTLEPAASTTQVYSSASLRGEYVGVVTHVTYSQPPDVEYCTGHVVAVFDGTGNVTITDTRRCIVAGSAPTVVTETGVGSYTVSSDGSVLIGPDDPDGPGHCQIVDRGKSLLCDGTMRTEEWLSWSAILMKR